MCASISYFIGTKDIYVDTFSLDSTPGQSALTVNYQLTAFVSIYVSMIAWLREITYLSAGIYMMLVNCKLVNFDLQCIFGSDSL